ncbi:MAG: TolC family protein [Ginsengibacter sp.]
MKKYISIIVFLLVFSNMTKAQQVLKLNDVLSAIKENNPALKVYDAQVRSLDEAAKGAKSWDAPSLGAGFFMTPYDISLTKASAGQKGKGAFAISATQMFPNKKEQQANAEYLQSLSSVNKEKKQFSLNGLYAEAKKNYFDWIVIQKKMSVLDDNEKLLNFMIESAELRYKNNLGKLNAYYKAKAALGKIEDQKLALENERKQDQIRLNTLMNREKGFQFTVDTNYTIKNYGPVDSNYFIAARSDIKAVEQGLQTQQLELDLEKAKQLPQFGISYNNMAGFGRSPWLFSLMATVKIPLAPWSAGRYKAKEEAIRWQEESYKAERESILNEATGAAENLMASINTKKKQLQLFEENIIPALQKNYKVMQLSYEQNTGELFELFDAWETLNMTQLDYLDQLQQLLQLQVKMDEILESK